MHNDIADALRVGEEFAPLLMEVTLESGETCFVADGWCRDFMEGVRLQLDTWDPHLDVINELIVPIAVLASLENDDPEIQDLLDDPSALAAMIDTVVGTAAAIYDYSRAVGGGPPQLYRRHDARVGRNDPCPCGSGKKYKKCRGSAANVHSAAANPLANPLGVSRRHLHPISDGIGVTPWNRPNTGASPATPPPFRTTPPASRCAGPAHGVRTPVPHRAAG
jgi:hypothetical protein